MNISEVTLICGEIPIDFKKKAITGSDYIFNVDPNFTPINLYNFWGNSATVNSFSECLHYVQGGFRPSEITVFDVGSMLLVTLIGSFFLYKIITLKIHIKFILRIRALINNLKKYNFSIKIKYLIFPFFLIQNYFLFDYVRTKTVRIPPFIDEYLSLTSNVGFFNNFDFNAGDFVGGSYSVLLTSGPISAIGGVIGWNLTSKLVIARISNFYWILFLQLFLSFVVVKIYKSEYKFFLFMNGFSLILIPWWQGSLYMIGEFASVIVFVNAIYIFNKNRKWAMFIFSLSIFFGKLLTLLPFTIIYVLSVIVERKTKTILSDILIFSIPLISWLTLVNYRYENGNALRYIENLFTLILNHQSSGLENSTAISEVSSWSHYEIVRILVVPILFIYLISKNKNNIDNIFGKISIPLAGSTIASYLWFWILSDTKWMRYSQQFTLVLVISLMYFIGFEIMKSRFDLFIITSSLAIYINNWKVLIFIFILFSFYFIFIQKKLNIYSVIKVLLVIFIFIDITIPYFQKTTFGDLHNIIDSCQTELVSPQCFEDYRNQ